MTTFSRKASSFVQTISRRRSQPSRDIRQDYATYQSAYMVIESMVNDLGEVVGELSADVIALRTDAERILRRQQIAHFQTERELYEALAWMTFYGNAMDLDLLIETKRTNVNLSPFTIHRIDRAIEAISERLAPREGRRLLNKWLYTAIAFCVLFSVFAIGPRQLLTVRSFVIAAGLLAGGGTTIALLWHSIANTREVLLQIAFVAAAFLMSVETVELLLKVAFR